MERKRLTREESRLMTRAMLIDAAEGVFLRRGFERASVEQITDSAGLSRGAFYSYFADKDEVALAVIDKRRTDVANVLLSLQRIADPDEHRAAVRDWFSKLWRQKDWIALRVEFSRRAVGNPALQDRLADLCRQEIRTMAQSFSRKGVVPAIKALALIAACHGLGSMGFQAAPDLDRHCEAAASFVFDCVGRG